MAQDTYQDDRAMKPSPKYLPRQKPQKQERSMCLSFPRRPPWPSRSSALRVGTGSTACNRNQWALDLEHLVLEVPTKSLGNNGLRLGLSSR